jgi:two-component system LytT family sensor kinase
MARLQQKLFRNVTIGELVSWLLYVLFWGAFFYFVLVISYKPTDKSRYLYINLMDAGIKILLTLPFWWLFIVKLANVSLRNKLLLHLVALPVFSIAWVNIYGPLVTASNLSVFDTSTSMWDIYITALFYCSEFAIFHGYSYWQQSKRQHLREQELMELNYQTEIKALKAQIEPHFLFNTLNSISASVPPSLEETRVLIAQLADTFRYALKMSERPIVSLEEEMEFVRTWLTLEKQRFGNRLAIIYDIDKETLSTPVPPMILQPLLENALNHGISPLVNGGSVTVSCKQELNHIRISVTDTGAGFDGPLETIFNRGLGLHNASRRLERLFGEPLTICRNEIGMSFSFRIPHSFQQVAQASSSSASLPTFVFPRPILPAQ